MSQNLNPKIIICDVNVAVMAYFFKSTMLDMEYSFGKIEIHQTVIDELLIWRKSVPKLKKFGGLGTIDSLIAKCLTLLSDLPILAKEEELKYFRRISAVESTIPNNKKGMETSKQDKTYLALAVKYKGTLATQEATLREITPLILSEKDLTSFEEMLLDAFRTGKIEKQDVVDGLANLQHYEESLRKGELNRIKQIVGL